VLFALALGGCSNSGGPGAASFQTINVSLKNTEVFQYPTVGGDEEGARISTQASHFTLSEIRRDEQTSWIATYIYQPARGFMGSDDAEIEVFTGSDGPSPPTHTRRVHFRFEVRD
jgi:hypothetical protein